MSTPTIAGALLLVAAAAFASQGAVEGGFLLHQDEADDPSAAYRWVDIMQEASARQVEREGAKPTIISRNMMIVVTAMYDAWAAYDEKAVGTRLGGTLRRPARERTDANKAKAIAYGAYRALLFVHPEDAEWIRGEMRRMGFDPDDRSSDVATPQGIGSVAAQAVIDFRRRDGANQLGDEPGTRTGKPFSDYTYYEPVNPGDEIVDPDRWQPIPFSDGKGGTFKPGFLTPHWYRVKPLMLAKSDQFRPGPPPLVGSEQLEREVDEVIDYNASLSLEKRAIVEFMRDGPRSTGQSGHWLRFAQDVSRRDRNGIDQDVKLFVAVGGVVFDSFVACWDAKRFYDSSRPWTLVRHYYKGRRIRGWGGPGKGVLTDLPAEKWHPYSPDTFVTPPFPGYPSGHSTASAAAATMLAHVTGSDRLGVICRHRAGELTGEGDFAPGVVLSTDGRAPENAPATNEIALECPTFWSTAEMAGLSRVMGGYHIQADNVAGLDLGKAIANDTWPKYRAHFEGTARGPGPEPP
jgi:hypothetical protein